MNRRGRRRQRGRRRLAVARGHVGQRLRCVRRIQRVGKQHGVVYFAAQRNAHSSQNVQRQLPIVHSLGHAASSSSVRNSGVSAKRNAQAASAHTPTLKRVFFSAASATSSSDSVGGASSSVSSAAGPAASRAKAKPCSRARHRMRRPAPALVHRSGRPKAPAAAGARSRSIDVNSSSVNSSRQASMSGDCVSIARQVQLQRHMAVDGDQLLRKQNRFAILLQRFAVGSCA